MILVLGCSGDASTPTGAASASGAPGAPASASPITDAAASALPSSMPAPRKLARRTTPAARAAKDQADCDAGNVAGCRSAADRYRGTGAVAGCGLQRSRGAPTIKVTPADGEPDRRAFLERIGKACSLGDQKACEIAKSAPLTYRSPSTFDSRYLVQRADPSTLGIWQFAARSKPEWGKVLESQHVKCRTAFAWWQCNDVRGILFRKEKPGADGKVPPARKALAEEICAATRDCDDIYMMLDREGYSPEELAPVRAAFATTLIEACLDGDCTCGAATKYLPRDDERWLDLASMGCENGEAEGCHALGRAYENGQGVVQDQARGRALYDLACPATRPIESSGVPLGETSPGACDRLAEIAIGPEYPAKDWERAMYYAKAACPRPGFAFDNAPCVRRGMLWIHNPVSTGRNGEDARFAAWGNSADPIYRDQCKRGSVKAECAAFERALVLVK
jgi:TPR repeat protein